MSLKVSLTNYELEYESMDIWDTQRFHNFKLNLCIQFRSKWLDICASIFATSLQDHFWVFVSLYKFQKSTYVSLFEFKDLHKSMWVFMSFYETMTWLDIIKILESLFVAIHRLYEPKVSP